MPGTCIYKQLTPANPTGSDASPTLQPRSAIRTLEPVSLEAQPSEKSQEFKPQLFNTEDLDIPTFLRNRK